MLINSARGMKCSFRTTLRHNARQSRLLNIQNSHEKLCSSPTLDEKEPVLSTALSEHRLRFSELLKRSVDLDVSRACRVITNNIKNVMERFCSRGQMESDTGVWGVVGVMKGK